MAPRRLKGKAKAGRGLDDLEEVIRLRYGDLQTNFYDVGKALQAIRDGRLYQKGYRTFEEYCSRRWDLARGTAYQYIRAAGVVDNVRGAAPGGAVPANEAQARPLTPLTAAQQQQAWRVAVETAPGGRVTAAHVQATVDRLFPDAGRRRRRGRHGANGRAEEMADTDTLDTALASLGRVLDRVHQHLLRLTGPQSPIPRAGTVPTEEEFAAWFSGEIARLERERPGWGPEMVACVCDAAARRIRLVFQNPFGPTSNVGEREESLRTCDRLEASFSVGIFPPEAAGGGKGAQVARVVEKWFRALVRDYHPDRGGSHEAMKAVNDANERLRKALGL
jgi:hypothetical protein